MKRTTEVAETQTIVLAHPLDGPFDPRCMTIATVPLRTPRFGEVVIENRYVRVDPSVADQLRSRGPWKGSPLGETIPSTAVGVVTESRDDLAPVGTIVKTRTGWRERATLRLKAENIVNFGLPDAQPWLSVTEGTGTTAFLGPQRLGKEKVASAVLVRPFQEDDYFDHLSPFTAPWQTPRGVHGGEGEPDVGSMRSAASADIQLVRESLDFDHLLAEAIRAFGGVDRFVDGIGGHELAAALQELGRYAMSHLSSKISFDYLKVIEGFDAVTTSLLVGRLTEAGYVVSDQNELVEEPERRLMASLLSGGELSIVSSEFDGLASTPDALTAALTDGHVHRRLVRVS